MEESHLPPNTAHTESRPAHQDTEQLCPPSPEFTLSSTETLGRGDRQEAKLLLSPDLADGLRQDGMMLPSPSPLCSPQGPGP